MAYTIKEGLQMVENFLPHILFLDNNLPDGKGWNYVDEIVEKTPGYKFTCLALIGLS
jgi:response regulator of citrate/malate metabolism